MARILFADDQDDFREASTEFLRCMLGDEHIVEECSNGTQAIHLLSEAQNDNGESNLIKLVVTDFEMGPGPDGIDVAREAVRRKVSTVYVSTGYSPNLNTDKSKRLREATGLPGVKIVDKMMLEDLEARVVRFLQGAK